MKLYNQIMTLLLFLLLPFALYPAAVYVKLVRGDGMGTFVAINDGRSLSFVPVEDGKEVLLVSGAVQTASGEAAYRDIYSISWYIPELKSFRKLDLNLPGRTEQTSVLLVGKGEQYKYQNTGYPINPGAPFEIPWDLFQDQ